jgi:hypothetical protein
VHQFNEHALRFFSVISKREVSATASRWLWRAELGFIFATGIGMMQIEEFAISMLCWFVLGFLLVSKALAWPGLGGNRWLTFFLKAAAFLFVAMGVLFLSSVNVVRRDDLPWTNVQRLWQPRVSFVIRVNSFVLNGALPVWARVDAGDKPYLCAVPEFAEMYITNETQRTTVITKLHVTIKDISGDWKVVDPIDTRSLTPYQGSNVHHLMQWQPSDNNYLDRNIRGKNIGPGQTVNGWLFMQYAGFERLKGPMRIWLSDIHGRTYPLRVEQINDSELPVGGLHMVGTFEDLSSRKLIACPSLGW